MKKIILIILLILNLFGLKIFSEIEIIKNNEKYKAVEFCIGGGISHNCYLMMNYYKLTDHNNMSTDITESFYFFPSQSIFLNIPFNFTYFINNKFGLGLNYTINFGILLYGGIYPSPMLFLKNQFRLTHKIGNIKKRKTLLIEYGFVLDIFIPFNLNAPSSMFYFNSYLLGPSFFIGYEFYNKQYKIFTFGGVLDATIQYNNNKDNLYDKSENLYINLTLGIEFRYRFGYFMEL